MTIAVDTACNLVIWACNLSNSYIFS